ncbi:hypothetical protein DFH28DRAFT_925025 [Melampsora americana]|nr:hypothetical protein DFH28DRAFT_925025 [Melampsora americana]
MNNANPLTQLPLGTDVNGLMSRVSQGFENRQGTVVKVHLFNNIAYYFALSDEEIMSCYIFALDMRPTSIAAGIPCEVIIYGSTSNTRPRGLSFQGKIIGRTVFNLDFVTEFSGRI